MMRYIILLATAVVYASAHHETNGPYRAVALVTSLSSPEIRGNVTFTQLPDGKIHVEGAIFGLNPGQYGFHVHEKGDITGGCLSTGAHFNPEHKEHGGPGDQNRHVGDLGNIMFDANRVAQIDFNDSVIALTGKCGILGRAVVLHEREDDFGKSQHPDSKKTGNAGGRVACGVIGILTPVDGWKNGGASTSPIVSVLLVPMVLTLLFNKL